ncbi:DUF6228 family protein [Streptomyces sp. NPDC059618]|uniref:DUF6228 family protein n=1 Tax=Streptomyces sp. NPDC059618 TaxID=3346887 RepID=UPI003692C1D2
MVGRASGSGRTITLWSRRRSARGGHVCLEWTSRSGFFPGDWRCTVATVIDAGEGMTSVAADLREFLHLE